MKRNNKDKKLEGRSSITGRFVTEKYAKENPNTTEMEYIKKGKKAKPGGKK